MIEILLYFFNFIVMLTLIKKNTFFIIPFIKGVNSKKISYRTYIHSEEASVALSKKFSNYTKYLEISGVKATNDHFILKQLSPPHVIPNLAYTGVILVYSNDINKYSIKCKVKNFGFFYSKYEIQKLSYLISKTICSTSKTLKRVDVIIYI